MVLLEREEIQWKKKVRTETEKIEVSVFGDLPTVYPPVLEASLPVPQPVFGVL